MQKESTRKSCPSLRRPSACPSQVASSWLVQGLPHVVLLWVLGSGPLSASAGMEGEPRASGPRPCWSTLSPGAGQSSRAPSPMEAPSRRLHGALASSPCRGRLDLSREVIAVSWSMWPAKGAACRGWDPTPKRRPLFSLLGSPRTGAWSGQQPAAETPPQLRSTKAPSPCRPPGPHGQVPCRTSVAALPAQTHPRTQASTGLGQRPREARHACKPVTVFVEAVSPPLPALLALPPGRPACVLSPRVI